MFDLISWLRAMMLAMQQQFAQMTGMQPMMQGTTQTPTLPTVSAATAVPNIAVPLPAATPQAEAPKSEAQE